MTIENRLFCGKCGKEIVGANQFTQVRQIIQQHIREVDMVVASGPFDKAKFDKDMMDLNNNYLD